MSQNNFVEQHIKKYGRALDYEEKLLKKEAREEKKIAKQSKTLIGLKAKIFKRKDMQRKFSLKRMKYLKKRKLKIKKLLKQRDYRHICLIDKLKEKNLMIRLSKEDKIKLLSFQYQLLRLKANPRRKYLE
ncbi:NSA2 [Hepatospora eriocheir]|uniref:NSA2 n=1 Tax=Hepatospora eriocheir TaxID=1081669 RepID=A0A1X0Q621_9MICR|nr:NSA2 [Hepatospora eriocheir]